MKPELLVLIALRGDAHREIAASFDVRYAPTSDERERAIAEHGGTIRAVLTNGSTGHRRRDRSSSATHVRQRARRRLRAHRCRPCEDAWRDRGHGRRHQRRLRGRSCVRAAARGRAQRRAARCENPRGRVARRPGDAAERRARSSASSAGKIGEVRARRLRHRDRLSQPVGEERPYRYFDRVDTLAQWADFLIVATPGGAGTRHLIDRAVLDALGRRVRRQRVTRQRCRYRCFGGRVA